MNKPFFTILIPTRNRPDLLRDALISALFQDFEDFEVVVSDNCNDDRTLKVLHEFRDHIRLRCIRTKTLLQMPEHWEFASRHAKGKYVMFLTDRSVLKRHALKTIHNEIKARDYKVEVCSWRWSLYDDVAKREFSDDTTITGGTEILSSKQLCTDFTEGVWQYDYSLPRGLNSCYRNELVSSLQEKYGSIFRPISPDFTLAFILLNEINSVLYIDQALFISQGLGASNGGNAFAKTAANYLQGLGDQDWLPQVPIKVPLVENIIYQDYLFICDLARGNLSEFEINWVAYFERCYRELIEKTGAGQLSENELKELYDEWSRALMSLNYSEQNEMKRRLKTMRWKRLKAEIRCSRLGPFVKKFRGVFQYIVNKGWQTREGLTVLEVSGFHDKNLRN